MARGLNKVMLIGNLGRDPETRYTQSGSGVTRFSVATSESWRDKSTHNEPSGTTLFVLHALAKLQANI